MIKIVPQSNQDCVMAENMFKQAQLAYYTLIDALLDRKSLSPDLGLDKLCAYLDNTEVLELFNATMAVEKARLFSKVIYGRYCLTEGANV